MKEATFGLKLTTTPKGYIEDETVTIMVPDTFTWECCYNEVQDDVLSAFYAEFKDDTWRDMVTDTPLLDLEK